MPKHPHLPELLDRATGERMIRQASGDILLSRAQVLAHGVAANDPMNQGLALQLREKYPSMHDAGQKAKEPGLG